MGGGGGWGRGSKVGWTLDKEGGGESVELASYPTYNIRETKYKEVWPHDSQ